MKANHSRNSLSAGAACLSLLMLTLAADAQTPRFQITAYTDRASGATTGGVFKIIGTAGQSEAVSTTNGVFTVGGGFWAVVQTKDAPLLAIERLSNGSVRIFWDRPATGFLLDEQGLAGNGTPIPWTPVTLSYQTNATHISITVPAPTGSRVFRLHKP